MFSLRRLLFYLYASNLNMVNKISLKITIVYDLDTFLSYFKCDYDVYGND